MKENKDFKSNQNSFVKLSCVPVSFFKSIISGQISFNELAMLCSSLGLTAVDLGITLLGDQNPAYLKNIRTQIEDAGIRIAGIMAYPDFTNPDTGQRKIEMAGFEKHLESACTLGAEFIRITAGQRHESLTRKKGIELAVEGVMKALELVKSFDIKPLFEHHAKPSIWQYPDFNLPTDIFLEIFEVIKGLDIGILFDTANPLVYGDDPFTILNAVYDRVQCVHISDIKTRGKQEMTVIGTGIVPIPQILLFLKQNKYDGWVSIEEASFTGEEGLKKAVSYLKKTLREMNY